MVLIGDHWLCSPHFIQRSYQRLETISAGMRDSAFQENDGEESARRLEECMRGAADVACSPVPPSNLDRARVIDVLLWASELHGRLRRSPRMAARIPVLLRSEALDRLWEEKTEALVLSRHGMQVSCRSEIRQGDTLTCVRLDSGQRTKGRVVWIRRKSSGEIEAGVEFSSDENFWGMAWNENREEARSV
jgi:PilZ domain-containing protein